MAVLFIGSGKQARMIKAPRLGGNRAISKALKKPQR